VWQILKEPNKTFQKSISSIPKEQRNNNIIYSRMTLAQVNEKKKKKKSFSLF